jgi:hypothetical protein
MTGQAAIVISFIIYVVFFGWLGFRRGARRELTVFLVALAGWLILQERGDIVVNIANLFGAAYTFATSGGFSGSADEAFAAIANAPELVNADARMSFLFVVWVVLFVATYAITNVAVQDKDSPRNGWAILFGILNGLFFGVAFVPSLVALFAADGTLPAVGADLNLLDLIGGGLGLLWNGLSSLWTLVESAGSLALIIILTLVLVLAAGSIKGSAKAKP